MRSLLYRAVTTKEREGQDVSAAPSSHHLVENRNICIWKSDWISTQQNTQGVEPVRQSNRKSKYSRLSGTDSQGEKLRRERRLAGLCSGGNAAQRVGTSPSFLRMSVETSGWTGWVNRKAQTCWIHSGIQTKEALCFVGAQRSWMQQGNCWRCCLLLTLPRFIARVAFCIDANLGFIQMEQVNE